MEIFNNREIALFLWTFAFLLWVSRNSSVRDSFKALVKTAFAPRLTSLWFTYLGYVAVIVYVLEEMGVWGLPHLKTTIYWGLSAGLLAIWRAVETEEFGEYIKTFVRDNLKLLILIEFIIAFFPLSLIAELFLVPVATVLAMMITFVQGKEEYRQVRRFLETLSTIIGVVVLIRAFHQLYMYFEAFARPGTLVDFALPPLLSTLLLPFAYVLYLLARYEQVFQRIDQNVGDNRTLRRYAKLKAVLWMSFRIPILQQWASSLVYSSINSKKDIDKSIGEHLEMYQMEKNPPTIVNGEGWSPYEAKEFLREQGLKAGYYHPVQGNEWYATAGPLRIGERGLGNNVYYHVSGTKCAAIYLQLCLNVARSESESVARGKFKEFVKILVLRATGTDCPEQMLGAIDTKASCEIVVNGKCVTLETVHWGNNSLGYLMDLELREIDPEDDVK